MSHLLAITATAKNLLPLTRNLVDAIRARRSDPLGQVLAGQTWLYLRQALITAGNDLPDLPTDPHPLADWIRELDRVAKRFNELVKTRRMDEILLEWPPNPELSDLEHNFSRLIDKGERLLREHAPKPVRGFVCVDLPPPSTSVPPVAPPPSTSVPPVAPPPPSTSAPPAGTRQSEGEKPRADTDADRHTDTPCSWDALGAAKRAILLALRKAGKPLQGKALAMKAGYKEGTLRHHYADLQRLRFITSSKDGYAITSLGAAIIPCESV